MKSLTPVVVVDEEKCVNCHMCISACPVKYCIDGTGDHVTINHDLCIGCGSCIRACTHDARLTTDDFEDFMKALQRGEPMVAIAAPAAAANFPDQHLQLNGYMQSIGVEQIFDVSFGAELTVKSYLEHVKANSPEMVIAQPCPAIVTYTEIYQPELLRHLAPADSPMLHTVKLIKEFFPKYAAHKVAVLSPCIAKRREFDETGLGDYNVTFASIQAHLEENNINLGKFEAVSYATPLPERAVLFSTPGGLKATVEREVPDITAKIRKIEGPEIIYEYLEKLPGMVEKGMNPLILDCLNCEMGCNGGTGTNNQEKSPDEVEHYVEKRKQQMQAEHAKGRSRSPNFKKKMKRIIEKYWKPGLYGRQYLDLSENYQLRTPNNDQLQDIYHQMLKYEEDDFLHCASCGYNSCEMMAVAIFNELNKPENCHHYKHKVIELEHSGYARISAQLHEEISKSTGLIEKVSGIVDLVNTKSQDQYASLEESSASVEEMISSIGNASKVATERREAITALVDAARNGEGILQQTVAGIEDIATSVESIRELIDVINSVAASTNLLSMNAAIEAAHAGDSGRGFSVVAEEIRKLAEATADNARSISNTLTNIIREITEAAKSSRETSKTVNDVIKDVVEVADSLNMLTNSMDEMSVGSGQIIEAITNLKNISYDVRNSYGDINTTVGSIKDAIDTITEISDQNITKLSTVDEQMKLAKN